MYPHPPPGGAPDPLLGQVLGDRFLIQARIGEGGMGVVYRATQVSVDRPVALKVLMPALASDAGWVARFINEARAVSRLTHPNTVHLFDFGQTRDGLLYMAMEFLDGESLRTVIARGPMDPVRVMRLLMQICSSLTEAHGMGIIHRDIKPDNIFVLQPPGSPDFVKVLDFSVAKLIQQGAANPAMQTRAGVVFGTPQYMSPEQGRGLPLDARSDLYALGIIGYEMLTGRQPFTAAAPLDVLAMHARTPPPPMGNVPEVAQRIILKALEKDPARRAQSAVEMHEECTRAFGELTGTTGRLGSSWPGMPGHVTPGQPMPGLALQGALVDQAAGMANLAAPPVPAAPGEAGTVLLQSSQGVVSFARQGGSPVPLGGQRVREPRKRKADTRQTSNALYWMLWIVAGIGVGLATYLAMSRWT